MRHSISYLPFYRVKIPHSGIQFAKPDKWQLVIIAIWLIGLIVDWLIKAKE